MAGVKITDLGVLTESASDDLLYIVDVSDTSQSPQGTSKQIEVGNLGKSYKVYTALLTQTGTNAPTAIELENTIGEISYNYFSSGNYYINSDGLFILDKTWISMIPNDNVLGGITINLSLIDNDKLFLRTNDGIDSDNVLVNNTSIEIRVYN